MAVRYKFVELSVVTDEALEDAVNRWVGQGWTLDGIHFAMREASRRPCMAFLAFVREQGAEPEAGQSTLRGKATPGGGP